jgi:hypothetical protein
MTEYQRAVRMPAQQPWKVATEMYMLKRRNVSDEIIW